MITRWYLRQKGLSTVEDLEAFLESSGKSAADYRSQMKPKEARSKGVLEEAGWVDSDGDGIREKDGQKLTLRHESVRSKQD